MSDIVNTCIMHGVLNCERCAEAIRLMEEDDNHVCVLESDLNAAKEEVEFYKAENDHLKDQLADTKNALLGLDQNHKRISDTALNVWDKKEHLREALEKIKAIENKMDGGDWDEIEEARLIAQSALAGKE